ncbi:outer membrane protein transport protein (OMPP1/FadL/TodX) [Flavobacterium sp. 103]|uniref:OmpP1/FadL family transporter n=1 Tax=Flavobacterium sp. 103 TaxID=2135624 RepID=UPI000D5F9A9C|nr:outer membrane protein transport protein [Flavobacterium sp. 103]PVX47019.1 outer membrane protein transport protein (OMPP1/FadL/TodX) [Flavobacterium sp. 103]
MKKNLLLFLVAGLTFSTIHSQEIKDAMRYTQSELHGTARFTAMSGAFGALGGDLSSINVNPAGSAVFNNNQFATTMGSYSTKNNSDYFGTGTSASDSNFDLNQAGGVFVFKTRDPNNDWKKFSMSINYENTNNYDNSLFSAGTSPVNSVANYFISYANGVPLDLLENGNYASLDNGAQQAFLGYQGYIINPVSNTPTNTLYTSNVRSGGNYHQENSTYSHGYNGKLIFNSGLQYKDFLYFGFNLNSHFTDYVQNTNFYESNNNPLDANYEVKSLNFSNSLHTYGAGFSFQVGAIAKLTNEMRLGFAYESPTWYNLQDELSQRLTAISSNIAETLPPDVVDPFVINYYAPYDLRTPGSLTGSFAYIFGKSGLISVDYKYKDYSCTEFSPTNDPYYRGLNSAMHNALGSSNEVRVGAEYKIQNFRLRGGYRFEGSPYNNSATVGDLNSFSGGLGYSFGSIKLDFSYVNVHSTSQNQFFSQGFTESARINTYKNNFTMTVIFEM